MIVLPCKAKANKRAFNLLTFRRPNKWGSLTYWFLTFDPQENLKEPYPCIWEVNQRGKRIVFGRVEHLLVQLGCNFLNSREFSAPQASSVVRKVARSSVPVLKVKPHHPLHQKDEILNNEFHNLLTLPRCRSEEVETVCIRFKGKDQRSREKVKPIQ